MGPMELFAGTEIEIAVGVGEGAVSASGVRVGAALFDAPGVEEASGVMMVVEPTTALVGALLGGGGSAAVSVGAGNAETPSVGVACGDA